MLTRHYSIIRLIGTMVLTLIFSSSAQANNESVIELSKSSRSETLGDIYTFGIYSSLDSKSKLNTYVGMNIIMIDSNDFDENDSTLKIFIGQSFGKTLAPFYEIGTDLYGFLTLLDNNNNTDTCTNEKKCSIDFYFKIGLKIKLGDHLVLGIFHENIDFGVFHEDLSGEHRYVGSSLGIRF